MRLTGKQKRYLRSLMVNESAIFQIGKEGLSDNLIEKVDDALEKRELIKIKVLKNCAEDMKELSFDLAMNTKSEVVQLIGRTFILYRKAEEAKIILP